MKLIPITRATIARIRDGEQTFFINHERLEPGSKVKFLYGVTEVVCTIGFSIQTVMTTRTQNMVWPAFIHSIKVDR